MDVDSFLAMPKWDILQIISERPSSPIEIAQITKTTVSYVSQQLKLLEAVGIVAKTKTGAFEKGKPRNVYSVREDFVHFTVLAQGYAEKKKLLLSDHHKTVLRIWMLSDDSLPVPLEKICLQLDSVLTDTVSVFLDVSKKGRHLVFVSDDTSLKTKILSEIKKTGVKADTSFVSLSDFSKRSFDALHTLFDPSGILKKEQDKLKGGIDNEDT